MPWLRQGLLFKVENLCWEKSTSCLAPGTVDLFPAAPKLPQMTPAGEGALPAEPRLLVQPALLPLEVGCMRSPQPTPGPGVGVGRADCILLLWG